MGILYDIPYNFGELSPYIGFSVPCLINFAGLKTTKELAS